MKKIKRAVALGVAVSMLAGSIPVYSEEITYDIWDGTSTTDWYTPDGGTEDSPYIIDSCSDFAGLAELSQDSTYNGFDGKYFSITENLDLNSLNWRPIGGLRTNGYQNSSISFNQYKNCFDYSVDYTEMFTVKILEDDNSDVVEFNGVINGNNKHIKNLTCAWSYTGSASDYIHGLFGLCGENSVIRDITIENAEINNYESGPATVFCTVNKGTIDNVDILSYNYTHSVSAIIGTIAAVNEGEIKNCDTGPCDISTQISLSNYAPAGGIAGYNAKNATISNCSNAVSFRNGSSESSGGIAGINEGLVEECDNNANWYTGYGFSAISGGIVGINGVSATVQNCVNNSTLGAAKSNPYGFGAGIAGTNYNVIKNCTNFGNITGNTAAGIVIEMYDGTIENCNNVGNVTCFATHPRVAAGIVASIFNGTIKNCNNYGLTKADGTGAASGLIGDDNLSSNAISTPKVTVIDCNNYGDVQGYAYGTGIFNGTYSGINGSNKSNISKEFTNVVNYGDVSASYSMMLGGFGGHLNNCKLTNCHNYGNVVITDKVNGSASCFSGFATGINYSTLENCTSVSDIYGSETNQPSYAGGFAETITESELNKCSIVDTNTASPIFTSLGSVGDFANNVVNTKITDCFVNVNFASTAAAGLTKSFVSSLSGSELINCIDNSFYENTDTSYKFLSGTNTDNKVENCFYKDTSKSTPCDDGLTSDSGYLYADKINTFTEDELLNGSLAYRLDKGSDTTRTRNWTVTDEYQINIDETVGTNQFTKTITIPANLGFADEIFKPVYKTTIGTVTGGTLSATGLASTVADSKDEIVYLREGTTPIYQHDFASNFKMGSFTYNNVAVPQGFTIPAQDIVLDAEYLQLFNITIADTTNGTLSANKVQATAGETITVTATPNENYTLMSISENGNAVSLDNKTFIMPAEDVTISAVFKSSLKNITHFELAGNTAVINGTDINVSVSFGKDISNVAPDSLIYNGASISPLPTDKKNFSDSANPVTYEVVAEDGSSITYRVNVTRTNEIANLTVNLKTEDGIKSDRKFRVRSSNCDFVITTNENGVATTTLPIFNDNGVKLEYTVEEIDKPIRYGEAEGEGFEFDALTKTLNFEDKLLKSDIKINVITNDTEYFAINHNVDNTVYVNGKSYTITGDNNITTEKFPIYDANDEKIEYVVSFDNNDKSYSKCNDQNVYLISGKTKEITFTKNRIKGNLKIQLKTSDDVPMSNIQFKISNILNTSYTATTNSNGEILFEDIPIYNTDGTKTVYTFEQVSSKDGYETAATQSTNGKENDTMLLSFTDNIKTGTLKIEKSSADNVLKGWKFKVQLVESPFENYTYDKTFTTDENGLIIINDVRIGKYKVSEITDDVSGYFTPDAKTTEVKYNSTATVNMTNVPYGSVNVTKVDKDYTNNKLSGAEFTVYASDKATVIGTLSEVSDGEYQLDRLPYGNYYLKETAAPENYVLDNNFYPFSITEAGQSVTVETTAGKGFEEETKQGTLKIAKHSADNVLGGWQFRVKLVDSPFDGYTYDKVFTTDTNGLIIIDNLRIGKYKISEVTTNVSGYITPSPQAVIIEADATATVDMANIPYGSVNVTKVDKDYTNNKLPGAEFTVYASDKITVIGTLSEVSDGEYQLDRLPYGNYYLKETVAPENYVLDNNFYAFSITEAGQSVTVETTAGKGFEETTKQGTLKIAKHSADNVLDGWQFRVKLVDSPFDGYTYDKVFTTDTNGLIIIDNLRIGKYEVSEITTNVTGYFTPESQVINVNADATATVDMTNIPYGSVHITKVDKDYTNNKLSGAEFTVYASDKTTVIGTLSEVSDGEYQLDRLSYGNYYLKETAAPENYVLDNNFYAFSITEAGQSVTVETTAGKGFEETTKQGTLKIAKHSADNVLGGWQFRVKLVDSPFDGFTYDKTFTTDANGLITINNLRIGRYEVSEVTTNVTGYFTPNSQVVNIEADATATVDMENIPFGKIVVNKVDAENNEEKLTGAKFTVYKDINGNGTYEEDIDSEYKDLIDNGDGTYSLDEVSYGKYLVKEISAPDGYVVDNNYYPVSVSNANSINIVSNKDNNLFVNEAIKGTVQLTKIDNDYPDNKLSGAEFTVYASDRMTEIGVLSEIENGVYSLSGLRYGEYYLKETKAPEHFNIDDNYYYFQILKDGETVKITNSGAGEGVFINSPKFGSLKIIKTSADNRVEGFSFLVKGTTYTGQDYEETFVTDENGIILIENLRAGEYIVHEIRNDASAGYVLPDDKTIIIEDETSLTIGMYNGKEEAPDTGVFPVPPIDIINICLFITTITLIIIIYVRKRK